MLNSFWGEFGERVNKPVTTQITSPGDLYRIIHDETVTLSTLRICNDDVLETVHQKIEEDSKANPKMNIFISAFTTCWERLKLYSYLYHVGTNVLYYDTDSVIYRWKPGMPEIPTRNFLAR